MYFLKHIYLLLGTYPTELKTVLHKNLNRNVYSSFIHNSPDWRMNKAMQCSCRMEHCSGIKRYEESATTWINFRNIMPSGSNHIQKSHRWFYLHEASRLGKSTEAERTTVCLPGVGGGGSEKRGGTAKGYRISSFWGDKNVLKLGMMMAT